MSPSVPVVECPGCKKPMRLLTLDHAAGGLSTGVFHCDTCGMETPRQFKLDEVNRSKCGLLLFAFAGLNENA
jgi:hypothetical protein